MFLSLHVEISFSVSFANKVIVALGTGPEGPFAQVVEGVVVLPQVGDGSRYASVTSLLLWVTSRLSHRLHQDGFPHPRHHQPSHAL
jgi:hypothetical protein